MCDLWRPWLEERAAADFDALAGVLGDQAGYAERLRKLIAHLDFADEGENDPSSLQADPGADDAEDQDAEAEGEGDGSDQAVELAGSPGDEAEDSDSDDVAEIEVEGVDEASMSGDDEAPAEGEPWRPPLDGSNRRLAAYDAYADEFDEVIEAAELVTGTRPFRASNLSKLLHQIVYATPAPIHTLRKDIPEELEEIVARALRKEPAQRFENGLAFAAALTDVYQQLRQKFDRIEKQQQFDLLRTLRFFHEFSHAEIWEVVRASQWQNYDDGEEIVREGEIDDRFYIIVNGKVVVERNAQAIGRLAKGDCFGETSYVQDAKRTATIRADGPVTLMKVSSTLLEQVSASCQLRFNKMFLRTLIQRLQTAERAKTDES